MPCGLCGALKHPWSHQFKLALSLVQATPLLPCLLHTCHLTLWGPVPRPPKPKATLMSDSQREELYSESLFAFIVRQREEGLLFHLSSKTVVFVLPLSSLGFEPPLSRQVWSQRDLSDWSAPRQHWLIYTCSSSQAFWSCLSCPASLEQVSQASSASLQHQLFGGHICFVSLFHVLWVERNGLKSFPGCVSVFPHSSDFMNLMVCYLVHVYSSQLILLCILQHTYNLLFIEKCPSLAHLLFLLTFLYVEKFFH